MSTALPPLLVDQIPAAYPPDRSRDEPSYSAATDLALELPGEVTLLGGFKSVDPRTTVLTPGDDAGQGTGSPVGFSSAFPVLSPAGMVAIRGIIDRHMDLERSSGRIKRHLRGLAYTSKWVRAWNECPVMLDHVSRLAGIRLVPHYMHSNYAHTNLSAPAPKPGEPTSPTGETPVDSWHVDSVPFVLVVVCSDMTDMVGGTLQVVRRVGREAALELLHATANNIPSSELMEARYVQGGYGIFMQGCALLHRVTPVLQAVEPRITVVNSYMPASVFAVDRTLPGTFILGNDGKLAEPGVDYEFARGRAQRAMLQLQAFVASPYTADRAAIAAALRRTMDELAATVKALEGDEIECAGFFDEKTGKFVNATVKKNKSDP